MVGGKDPPGFRPTKLSLVERPPLSPVQASGICLPLAGISVAVLIHTCKRELEFGSLSVSLEAQCLGSQPTLSL
jgi:hypothetical protein